MGPGPNGLAAAIALAREGWTAHTTGMAGQARHYGGIGIGDIMRMPHFPAGSVEYAEAPVGR